MLINRFYLDYCGGNGTSNTGVVNDRNGKAYSGITFVGGEQDQDSDQVHCYTMTYT